MQGLASGPLPPFPSLHLLLLHNLWPTCWCTPHLSRTLNIETLHQSLLGVLSVLLLAISSMICQHCIYTVEISDWHYICQQICTLYISTCSKITLIRSFCVLLHSFSCACLHLAWLSLCFLNLTKHAPSALLLSCSAPLSMLMFCPAPLALLLPCPAPLALLLSCPASLALLPLAFPHCTMHSFCCHHSPHALYWLAPPGGHLPVPCLIISLIYI